MKQVLSFLIALVFLSTPSKAQTRNPECTTSNFGASFTFSTTPIARGCVQVETGGIFNRSVMSLSHIATFGISNKLDVSVATNSIDRVKETTQFKNHYAEKIEFIVRRELKKTEHTTIGIAPRGTFFRNSKAGGIGGTFIVQYERGQHLVLNNTSYIKGLGNTKVAPGHFGQHALNYGYKITPDVTLVTGALYEQTGRTHKNAGVEGAVAWQVKPSAILEAAYQRLGYTTGSRVNQWQFRATFMLGKLY